MESINIGMNNIKSCLLTDNYCGKIQKFSSTNKAGCLGNNESCLSTTRIEGTGGYPINLLEQPLTP